MSVAERYGRPREPHSTITQLDQGVMREVQQAGKTLADLGVKQKEMAQGQQPYALPTPAQRFARPANNNVPARGRSL